MKRNCLFILMLIGISCFYSCIKEEVKPCEDQYDVQLYVKDKNYIGDYTIDEGLPFNKYVDSIYYVLHNIKTGNNIYSSFIPVKGNGKEYPIQFSNMPDGDYVLTVWGNISNTNFIDNTHVNLHPDHLESKDIYLATGYLTFTSDKKSMSLGLERTKGKLRIICTNFPDSVNKVDIQVKDLYQNTETYRVYSGETEVIKTFALANSSNFTLETILAPTGENSKSKLILAVFEDGNSQPLFVPAEIDITIKRNEITYLEINYNNLDKMWEIWIQIDNQWEMVYQLGIF